MPNEKRGSKPNGGKRPQRPNQRSRDERARTPERRASGPRPAGRGGPGRSDSGPERPERPEPAPPTPMDEWIDEGVIPATKAAVRRSGGGSGASEGRSGKRSRGPRVDVPDLSGSVGKTRGQRLEGRVEEAARAFAAQRYLDAQRLLRPIAQEVPRSPEVRELYGLTLYRLGKWKAAAAQLEAFVDLTGGSVEQHPVLADCYRAMGQHPKVDALWRELRDASPSADLVTEGRIVAAGSLADRGELSAAVQMLSKGFKLPARHSDYHLARAYALADLYERSGDVPQARQLFSRLESLSPGYSDVPQRLSALG